MGDDEAVRDFPNNDQRFAFCNSVYERARNMTSQQFAVTIASLNAAALRTEQLMGHDYLVVPAVLVQGQVLNNNLGTTFLPPDEITDAWAQEWNGVPVVIHDHPTQRGVAVSARTPEILDLRGVGYVFHARATRNGQVQLKGEVWLDVERAEELPELDTIMGRLRVGEKVELSTGFAATTEETPGVHNGESYDRVLHPHGADHLAIFVDSVGACSLKDGCGLGVQQQQSTTVQTLIFPKDHWDSAAEAKKWAKDHDFKSGSVDETDASYRLRQKAPSAFKDNSFRTICLTGADTPGDAACRIKAVIGKLKQQTGNTEEGDAMQESDKEGLVLRLMHTLSGYLSGPPTTITVTDNSEEEDATITAENEGNGGCGGCGDDDEWKAAANAGLGVEARLLLRRLKALDMTNKQIGEVIGRSASTVSQMERGEVLNPAEEVLEKLRNLARQRMGANADNRSDEERRMMLATALESRFGGAGKMVWIDAVFSEERKVVFGVAKEDVTGKTEQLFSASFEMPENSTEITFMDPAEVARRVVYEPVGNEAAENKETEQMNEKEKVENQVEETKVEDQVEETKTEETKTEPVAANQNGQEEQAPTPEKQEADGKDEVIAALQETIRQQGEQIAEQGETIAALQETVKPAVEERERKRQSLVEVLAANESVPFDKAELEAKPVEELEKLQAMARGEHYAGRGGPQIATQAGEPQFAEPVKYWETDTQQKKDGE
jgi:transcriptional regulator with XRE-family HTH domain